MQRGLYITEDRIPPVTPAPGENGAPQKEKRMNIINFIPIGHKNAISRVTLQSIVHMSDRKMRELIAEVNANDNPDELIINLQYGKGYFRPAPLEDNLVRIWGAMEHSRGTSVNQNVRAADSYLNRHKKKTERNSPVEENQMTIAEWLSTKSPGEKVVGCQTEF